MEMQDIQQDGWNDKLKNKFNNIQYHSKYVIIYFMYNIIKAK